MLPRDGLLEDSEEEPDNDCVFDAKEFYDAPQTIQQQLKCKLEHYLRHKDGAPNTESEKKRADMTRNWCEFHAPPRQYFFPAHPSVTPSMSGVISL